MTRLRFPRRITRKHARVFVESWLTDTHRSGAMYDAFAATGVIEWPDRNEDGTPAQARYSEVEEEILERTVDAVREVIAEAFRKAANEVIERERRSGGKRKP